MAASARNPGVLWAHNDGARSRVFALGTNGAVLATVSFTNDVDDFEDMAIYDGRLYLGDIGGSKGLDGTRAQVKILRVPEPAVSLDWAANPVAIDVCQVESFTLAYPDGSYDAETLWVDPISGDVFVVTKGLSVARVYRANFASATLEFVIQLNFPVASGGDISADGTQIALRREQFAMLWGRCDDEPLSVALGRAGQSIPVIGPPDEPNGEALAFFPDGTRYATISEGLNPAIYFFQSTCPAPARFTVPLSDETGIVGGTVRLNAAAAGYPSPTFAWRFKGALLPGETNSFLIIPNLAPADAGQYEITASNPGATVTSSAMLTIITKADLRITEVQAAPSSSGGDWWELTSFETQPVNLGGWRFNDNAGAFSDPFIFPPGLTIQPGESVVFVEGLTENQFRAWWGLPAGVQILTYSGDGLGFGANGDGVRLWNNFTTNPVDTVSSVNFGSSPTGVSFNYDPVTGQFGALSQLGVNGVFRAAAASDIGSPGRILAPPVSPRLTIRRNGSSLRIEFDAAVGRRHLLEVRDELTAPWSPTGDVYQAPNNSRAAFQKDITSAARFFRVEVR